MIETYLSKREALGLWDQMLDRARDNEWSTFDDPDYVHAGRDAASVSRAFLDAGWAKGEISSLEKGTKDRSNAAPVTSPGVARHTEAMLDRLARPIENAAIELNIENRDKVHFVVEPKAGPFLSKVNVVMTDQSIITMGSFFPRYCGLISRAFIRTMLLAPMSVGNEFDEAFLRSELRKRPDLLLYWWQIFLSFALTGTHIMAPFKPSTKDEMLLMEQVAFSMEIFGLGHEYGHHALNHGRAVGGVSEAHREEFEADSFAMEICNLVEAKQRYAWIKGQDIQNPYLWTGAGGILLLSSLEVFRKVKDSIYANKVYDTHPNFLDRSMKIKSRNIMQPSAYWTSRDFCGAVENVLRCVMEELEPVMGQHLSKSIRDFASDDWEVKSFE